MQTKKNASRRRVEHAFNRTTTKTRREFLREAAVVGAGLSCAACIDAPRSVDADHGLSHDPTNCGAGVGTPAEASTAIVAEVIDSASIVGEGLGEFQLATVEAMVEDALAAITGGAAKPWHHLLPDYHQKMRIGLKVNHVSKQCPTSIPLVKALVASLKGELGIAAERIIVWDRLLEGFSEAGYDENDIGAPLLGTAKTFSDPTGPGYESAYCVVAGETPTRLSKIFTELTDVTINCPVLKKHNSPGFTAAMKNVFGVIHNPWDFHVNIQSTLAEIYALAPIRSRIRLNVLDALRAVSRGYASSGPDAMPKRVLMSTDPLAIDLRALSLLNQVRQEYDLEQQAHSEETGEATHTPIGPIDPSLTQWLDDAYERGVGDRSYQHVVVDRG